MSEPSYGVQFYTGDGTCLHDEVDLPRDEAVALFNKFVPQFIARLGTGDQSELALWKSEDFNVSYGEAIMQLHSDDYTIVNGQLHLKPRWVQPGSLLIQ